MNKGNFNLSRPQTNWREDYICLTLRDEASYKEVLQIEFDPKVLMMALTGVSHQACDYEIKNFEFIGKIREHKTEIVPRPKSRSEDDVNQVLAPLEVDGWQGNRSDVCNHHCWVGNDEVNVGFVRWVDKDD